MTGKDTFVEVSGLAKSYGQAFALEIPQLTVHKHEILCVLGPTGSGKSTLLRLLAGLDDASRGEIRFDGQPLAAGAVPLAQRRRLSMVFQRPLLLSGSVRVNVECGLRWRGQAASCRQRVDPLLERLGLATLSEQSAHTLSGGQTQLVALARALVTKTELLLLDEPTANLDPARVALVERTLAAARDEDQVTVIWATHNVFQARRVADRVVLLLDGRLVEVAPATEFFESPSDPRTAEFVEGRMIY